MSSKWLASVGCWSCVWLLLSVPVLHGQSSAPDGAIFATTQVFPNGSLVRLNRQAPWQPQIIASLVSPNANLVSANNLVFVLDSAADEVLMFHRNGVPAGSFLVGKGTNPRDIAVVGENLAYVSRSNATHLYRVDPQTGVGQEIVDLSIFADDDGIPDMERMIVIGNRLFVQLRRIANPPGPTAANGAIAVVDLNTETIVDANPATPEIDAIALVGPAPRLPMYADPSNNLLLVSATDGFHLSVNGGIEMIDLSTLQSDGLLLAELELAALGGFAITTNGNGYFVFHTDIVPSNHLLEFSLDKGAEFGPEIVFDFGVYLDALLYDPGSEFLFMPSSPGGLYVVDTNTNQQVPGTPIAFPGAVVDQIFVDFVAGDINGDGIVSLLDVAPFVQLLDTGMYQDEADLNADGAVNLLDVEFFVDLLSGS